MRKVLTGMFLLSLVMTAAFSLTAFAQKPGAHGSHQKTEPHKHEEPTLVFFKINGHAPVPYLQTRNSSPNFQLPFFSSPQTILVNEDIDIEINPKVLESASIKAHNSTIPDAKFIWDFGDGKRGSGIRNRHRYTKPGSYILGVYIESKLFDEPKLYKTVLFHILPNKDYQLPKAVIEVNGQVIREGSQEVIKTSFREPVRLGAMRSVAGTSELVEYVWDLSDRSMSKEATLSHSYNQASYNAKPILRVKDKNGFISDAYVEILNLDTSGGNKEAVINETRSKNSYHVLLLVVVLLSSLSIRVR
jgi:hypothetical protein